jgi:hypothetical protein
MADVDAPEKVGEDQQTELVEPFSASLDDLSA